MSSLNGEAVARLRDGRALTLAFDFDAMVVIEDLLDVNAMDLLKDLAPAHARPDDPSSPVVKPGRTPRLKEMRALIAGALHRHHPDIPITEVGDLIVSDGEALSEALGKAVTASFGGGDKEAEPGEGEAGPPRPGRGTGRKR